jgi:hypothetical protein
MGSELNAAPAQVSSGTHFKTSRRDPEARAQNSSAAREDQEAAEVSQAFF